jgi:hypothetical protein
MSPQFQPEPKPASAPLASAPVSAARQFANAQNARKSTGPKTAAGKQVASMNAYRHGLTSQRVLFEGEDQIAYISLGARWVKRMEPVGIFEISLLQKIIDTSWRIDRAAVVDNNLFASKTSDLLYDQGRPLNTELGFAQARAFDEDCAGPNSFLKVTLYQSRLERSLERFTRMFYEEQERRADGRPTESFEDDRDSQHALHWYRQFRAELIEQDRRRAEELKAEAEREAEAEARREAEPQRVAEEEAQPSTELANAAAARHAAPASTQRIEPQSPISLGSFFQLAKQAPEEAARQAQLRIIERFKRPRS